MIKKHARVLVLIGSLFLVSSCNVDAGNAVDLTDVKNNQQKILKKLEAIEKNQLGIKNSISSINKPANNKKQQPKADPNKVYDIAIGDSYVWGNKNAPITIIEWTDFQWPHCARAVSLIDDIVKKYPNDVQVVIKNFPLSFHKQAKKAGIKPIIGCEIYVAVGSRFEKIRSHNDFLGLPAGCRSKQSKTLIER